MSSRFESGRGHHSQHRWTIRYNALGTATLPKGWKGRLVNLPAGDTEGVRGLCLDPHDLAIAEYVACREKDVIFTRELLIRGIVSRDRLHALLEETPITQEMRERIRAQIARDLGARKELEPTAGTGTDRARRVGSRATHPAKR
jgi:hypothetical protein